jgi:hypothetical protein
VVFYVGVVNGVAFSRGGIMTKIIRCIGVLFLLEPTLGVAGPHTGDVYISIIRPVTTSTGEGFTIIQTNVNTSCGSAFKIDTALPGGKEIFSVALSAHMANRKVNIELVDSGCAGWGTPVKSIYLSL